MTDAPASTGPSEKPNFRELLIGEMPSLRAFALSLSGSVHKADDLVQDTLLKAWSNADKFEINAKTNLPERQPPARWARPDWGSWHKGLRASTLHSGDPRRDRRQIHTLWPKNAVKLMGH